MSTEPGVQVLRSVLYMPSSNARALEKAKTIPADAIIFDLEDAVAPDAAEVAWAKRVVTEMGEDGRGAVMIDGKMQDDATYKQCKVVLQLASQLAARDPELAAAYAL